MELENKFLVWKLSDLDTFLTDEEKGLPFPPLAVTGVGVSKKERNEG